MTGSTFSNPLRGIIPPMITPLKNRDELDYAGLEKLIHYILAGGVHGLFVLGTTGEAPSLSYRLRRELIERVCQQVADRVPVLVGITDTSFVESINLARFAANAGAHGLMLAPPYYFPVGQEELLEYLQHIVPELPLPLFLYNIPSTTKLIFEPATVRRALDISGIVGLKDSSGNMVYFHRIQRLLRDHPDFSLLIGQEGLLAETVMLGGHGGITGGANLFPQLYVELYNAALAKDHETVKVLHEIVIQINDTIYSIGRHNSSYLKGLKCALSLMGICDDFMAEPFHRFRDAERNRVREHLEHIESLIAKAIKDKRL